MYNFDEIIDRHGTNCAKYGVSKMMYPSLPDDYIPMWVADMDFACPQPVLDAMKDRLDRRILGYSMILDPEYYEALGKWMLERHNWQVDPRQSVFSAGVVKALNAAVKELTKPADGVIISTPAYHPFEVAVETYGRTPVFNKLINTDGYYTMDWEDFETKCKDENNTLYFLCNPHNPTGRVWTKEELIRIGEICFANNVFVVSDEIHFDFIRAGIEHTVFASLFPEEKRVITCTAPSKTFNLAGNELSNIFIPDQRLHQSFMFGGILGMPNPLSIDACKAAYLHCADWVDELNVYLDDNFKLLSDRIEKEMPNIKFKISESTYLAWLDVSETGLSMREMKLRLVEAGLHLQFAGEFVAHDDFCIRMNISCPRSVLNCAIDRLKIVFGADAKPATKLVEVGESLENVIVDTATETGVELAEITEGKNTMLIFLRYVGCTICQLDMHKLAQRYDEIEAMGGKAVVVLQSAQDKVALKDLPFTVICDPELTLYNKFGVLPAAGQMELLDDKLMMKMGEAAQMGFEHGDYEGNELQIPASIAVDGDLKVTYVHYGTGLSDTPTVDEIMEILR